MQKLIDKWHEEQTAYAASILTIPEPFSETTNAGRMSMAYHDGGIVGIENHHNGNVAGGLPKIKESEVFAKLLKGEVVATESQMKNFINNTLPALSTNISGGTNIGNIQLSFNIAGDLDRSVVPDIKNIITETLMDITKSRGILRNANSFSL
jgi:hypothetical protein